MTRTSWICLTFLVLFSLLLTQATHAQPRPPRQPGDTSEETTGQGGTINSRLRGQTGQLSVVIELADAPTAQLFARAQSGGPAAQAAQTAQAQLARVEQAQQSLLPSLAQLGARVIYRTQRVYNGIAAHVDAARLAEIARLPGVKAIHPQVKHSLNLDSSVPLIGAPQLWAGAGLQSPLTGAGIKIGVIDTGVDYLHTGFGGPGTQAAYDANNTKVLGDAPFPSVRVIGGYDFAGDDYTGSNNPQPDPDPMDCNGHGSHVAGIAAGNGVTDTGAAYAGPYDTSTHANVNFRIGPGVAPQASLFALRVFGCDGSTELVPQAIEWAVDPNGDGNFSDHLDVINMSLGSDFGYENDSTSVAADNAVLAGVIVVASAGNDGDSTFITGSPGSAGRVISVASSVDATDILDGFRENTPTARTLPASYSAAFDWAGMPAPVTRDLVYPPTQRSGCQAFTPANAALISGKIVLLDWTDNECGSIARGANLVAAGAAGSIVVDNGEQFDLYMTGSATIPMVSAPKLVGDALKTDLSGGTVNVTLSGQYTSSTPYTDARLVDTISAFSSRGPRREGSALKPDISAPGQGIFSVGALTRDEGANISGTSMAAPHIAGAMVLLRQLHPTWTVAELKALAMNTAVNNLRSDLPVGAPLFSPARIGAGRADLPRAAASNVIAFEGSGDGLVSVSFGHNDVVSTMTVFRSVQIANKNTSPVTYNLAYVPVTTAPGVAYTLSASSVTVPAAGVATVTITMSANAQQMKHVHDPTLSETQQELARPWLSEASGYLALTESGLATSQFSAWISANQENPPSSSDVTATGNFTYTAATGSIEYRIAFDKPIVLTAAHFHRAPAGQNGPVILPIATGDTTFGPGDPLIGSSTVPAGDRPLLLQGGLYVNFHTAAFPGGEIRGQLAPSLVDTVLRVPVYASARPASGMRAVDELDLSDPTTLSATLVLTGTGVNTGSNYPHDVVSLVSPFELQYISPNEPASDALNDKADLAYVGVTSNVASTSAFTETTLSFGLATHGAWSTPNTVEFQIFIDTDRDGTDDFVLFNSNLGYMTGNDRNDVLLGFIWNLETNDLFITDYVNGMSPGTYDTAVFNSNVLALSVAAADLGLTAQNARFNYRVVTLSQDAPTNDENYGGLFGGIIDSTTTQTYDAAHPGISLLNSLDDTPLFEDLPGEDISLAYNAAAFDTANSKGMLLLHYHNTLAERAQVLRAGPLLAAPAGDRAKPGSYFTFEASGFAPGEATTVAVDDHRVLTLNADNNGNASFVVYFPLTVPQRAYTVTVSSVAQEPQLTAAAREAQQQVTIDGAAPALPLPASNALPLANALPALLTAPAGDRGKPGSYFTFEAEGFVPQEAVTIAADGRTLLTLNADTDGHVSFVLFFPLSAPQRSYTIVASSVTRGPQPTAAAREAQRQVTVDGSAAMLPLPANNTRPVVYVLPVMVYLPIVQR
jgi:subtilisin family serine protease